MFSCLKKLFQGLGTHVYEPRAASQSTRTRARSRLLRQAYAIAVAGQRPQPVWSHSVVIVSPFQVSMLNCAVLDLHELAAVSHRRVSRGVLHLRALGDGSEVLE